MLSCVNVCHGRIKLEEVCVKGFADEQEQQGIDGRLVENPLEGTWCHADLLREPRVRVSLSAQLVTNEISDEYPHLRFPVARLPQSFVTRQTAANKKRRANSSPV